MEIMKISSINNPRFLSPTIYLSSILPPTLSRLHFSTSCPSLSNKFHSYPCPISSSTARKMLVLSRAAEETTENSVVEEEEDWVQHLPEKTKPLYSHSLPCVEGWLKKLGFYQSKDDRAVWFIEKPDWHAQLNLDVTDLYIRYLKSGPGNLDKDVERKFSYALSREDIENAILGGP